MKLKGLKKAVGDYKRANGNGYYSPRYGLMYFDKSTGEVWTDEHYDSGHGTYFNYISDDIVCISNAIEAMGRTVNMKNVRDFIEMGLDIECIKR